MRFNVVIAVLILLFAPSSLTFAERDPTMPFGYQVGNTKTVVHLEPLKLSAIFSKPSGNTAVVNDKILSVGDKISGWEVLTITTEAVTLKSAVGGTKTLQLLRSIKPVR